MPIYEYYCPDNHTIYQFYAKTLAQGQRTPKCPDNPRYRMEKIVSPFAVTSGTSKDAPPDSTPPGTPPADDPRMDAAMAAMEREFAHVDENDPRAMGRMMRRMAELTGEKIDGEMEEVVRKLEEGTDPDSLEESLGHTDPDCPPEGCDACAPDTPEPRPRYKPRPPAPTRDPQLYDYP